MHQDMHLSHFFVFDKQSKCAGNCLHSGLESEERGARKAGHGGEFGSLQYPGEFSLNGERKRGEILTIICIYILVP